MFHLYQVLFLVDCTIIGCDAGGNVAGGGAKIVLIGGNAGYNATTPSNIVVMGSSAAFMYDYCY